MKKPFWVWPPLWVWVLFLFSLSLAATAWVTTSEGLRYVSRALNPDEQRVLLASLEAWDELTEGRARVTTGRLRVLLNSRRLRCLHGDCFTRTRERSTFGYTDERGRILVNPRLCFGSLIIRGRGEVYAHDLVVTLSTLVHEDEHYSRKASEHQAYRVEWEFLRKSVQVARSRDLPYAEALERWEDQTSLRVEEKLGAALTSQIQAELDTMVSYQRRADASGSR